MWKQRLDFKKIKSGFRSLSGRMLSFIRRHFGSIVYYSAIAVVLSAVAIAADYYRADDLKRNEALFLPAVQAETTLTSKQKVLHAPQNAKCIKEYGHQPEWNVHLGQWQSHPATDYILQDDVVYSLSTGRVRTIGKSGVYGGFIEIETGDYLLRYASITPLEEMEVGMEVELGAHIAFADTSMPGECGMEAHLHLELLRDGEMIDFAAEADKIESGR